MCVNIIREAMLLKDTKCLTSSHNVISFSGLFKLAEASRLTTMHFLIFNYRKHLD